MAIKYYLGVDLGISSCGWAVMGEDDSLDAMDDDKYWIDDFGVRIFEPVELAKEGTTLCQKRRGFRSQRRLLTRRKNRIRTIKKILNNCNFLSAQQVDQFINSLKQKEGQYKIANTLVYDETKYINPYVLG